MPFIVAALALLVLPLILVLIVPFSVIQRYRTGTARRPARGWVAALNFFGMMLSAVLFLLSAAISSAWVPGAFSFSALGMAGGCLLGAVGLALTRWETSARSLHYTPNRWLVLLLTLVVTLRLGFGLWRVWQAWRFSPGEGERWIAAAAIPNSMAVGALMLGYYLAFWAGVWLRLRAHQRKSRVFFASK